MSATKRYNLNEVMPSNNEEYTRPEDEQVFTCIKCGETFSTLLESEESMVCETCYAGQS